MLFDESGIAAVIDYDSARLAPRVLDIANGALQFSILAGSDDPHQWPSEVDLPRLAEFLRGYRSSGRALEEIISVLRALDVEVHGRDSLKSAPRGYSSDHPRIALLRHKGLVAWKEWPVEPWLATPMARKVVAEFLAASRPLGQWLAQHVGDSAEPPRR
jgi:Ser/Thr protein kinase RdoA (MazF antagonist)